MTAALLPRITDAWALEAACRGRGQNADWWFPTLIPGRHGTRARWGPDAQHAIRICRICPVVERCLAYALEHNEGDGIWGGKMPQERKPAIPQPPQLPPMSEMAHGTEGGWKQHKRRNQRPCSLCEQGNARAQRNRKNKAKAQ